MTHEVKRKASGRLTGLNLCIISQYISFLSLPACSLISKKSNWLEEPLFMYLLLCYQTQRQTQLEACSAQCHRLPIFSFLF